MSDEPTPEAQQPAPPPPPPMTETAELELRGRITELEEATRKLIGIIDDQNTAVAIGFVMAALAAFAAIYGLRKMKAVLP